MSVPLKNRDKLLAKKQVHITCIIPAFNEAALIGTFIEELNQQLQALSNHYQILVIDDGSEDHTAQITQQKAIDYPVQLVSFSRNFGKENAIAAGLKYCTGDVAIIIDADFQHPIATIPLFLNKWAEGYDMVYGVRQNRRSEKPIRQLFTKLFYRLLKLITRIDIPINAGDFRLLDGEVINALNNCEERTRFMKGLYAWVGFNTAAIPFQVAQRPKGKSQYHFRRLTSLALTGLISFSDIPLRIWGIIGLSISLISFCSIVYIILNTLIYGADVPGYATILVTIVFFGGIQLLSIGILGEYIARIFHEVKKRPSFIIKKNHESLNKDLNLEFNNPSSFQDNHSLDSHLLSGRHDAE